MRVRATIHRSPNSLGMVLRILRRRPHRKLATVTVVPRAQQTAPSVTVRFSPAPPERFGISHRRFDLLVRMPGPAQIVSILYRTSVNKCQHQFRVPLQAWRTKEGEPSAMIQSLTFGPIHCFAKIRKARLAYPFVLRPVLIVIARCIAFSLDRFEVGIALCKFGPASNAMVVVPARPISAIGHTMPLDAAKEGLRF